MAKEIQIASIDIGSSKIRTIVGVLEEDQAVPNIIGVGLAPSSGMRKGAIIDVEETVNNIMTSLEDAERMSGSPINHVFIGVSGGHIESFDSKGVIAISGSEITEEDMNRVLDAAQAVSMPPNRRILRIIPKSFSVDEQKKLKNPVGMTGIRLEVDAHIVTGHVSQLKNIEKCVLQAGVDIDDIFPNNLAAAEAVLSRRQKELGVVSIDIGSGSTNVVVYEEGTVLHTATLPIGGESVTNDIAIGLRTSVDTAEKIKIEYGTNLPDEVSEREIIDLSSLSSIDNHKVSKKHLAEIIQARYHEMLLLVKEELRKIGRDGMLPAGAMLTGAAIKMPGTIDLAREVLNLPVQIAFPSEIHGVVEKIDDPSYATAIGILLMGSKFEGKPYSLSNINLGKFVGGMKKFFRNLLP